MVHTTSAQVRLAKLDRQIAELQIERAKITGQDWEPIWFKAEGERIAALKGAGSNEAVADPIESVEQPKQKRVRMAGIEETILDKLDHVGRDSEWLQQETGLDRQRLWRGLRKLVGQGRVQKVGNTRAARYSLRVS